jgi:hypothetical protein
MPLNVTNTLEAYNIADAGSWGGTVIYLGAFVLLPLAIFIIGIAVLWNLANYTRFKKYFQWLAGTLSYFVIGAISIVVISIPFALLYWGYTEAQKGNTVPIEYTVYIILGYIAISLIGWFISKFVINRVKKFEKELKEPNKKIEKIPLKINKKEV